MTRWSYADEALSMPWDGAPMEPTEVQTQPPPRVQPGARVQNVPEIPPRRAAPAPRPAPQPQAEPAPVAPSQPQPQGKPWSYADEALNLPTAPRAAPAVPTAPATEEDKKFAEPDAETWLGRRWQDIRGKRDKRYESLPSISETGVLPIGDENVFNLTGQGDKAYGDFIVEQLGDKVTRRFKDANGYEIIGFKMPDGKEQLGYVNKPSWEGNDIERGVMGALPFLAGGAVTGAAVKAAPIAARVLAQGATGAGVSAVQDSAAGSMGSKQGVDATKAVVAGVGGAAGEALAPVVGAALRRYVIEPRLINKQADATVDLFGASPSTISRPAQLTDDGMEAAKRAGFDPAEITDQLAKEFASQYAKLGNSRAAGVAAEMGDLNIPTTLGQRTKDVKQLSFEQAMRDGVYGSGPQKMMKEFDDRQWEAMTRAAMGDIRQNQPGVSRQIAPDRSPIEYTAPEIGAGIKDRLTSARDITKKTASDKWDELATLNATDESLAELPSFINSALGDMKIAKGSKTTPTAEDMLSRVTEFMKGEAPKQAEDWLSSNPVRDVDVIRKELSRMRRGLDETTADGYAAKQIYKGFTSWIEQMAERKMLEVAGTANVDAAKVAADMAVARGLTFEFKSLFDKPTTRGGKIVKEIIDKVDSGDQVVRTLFVGPTARGVKPGAIEAINAIKQAATKLPKEEADALMGDMKLAYWLNLARNPAGGETTKLQNPQTLLKNIRLSLDNQSDVWKVLFTPEDRVLVNRFVRALERGPTFHDWTVKPNSSRSATVGASLLVDIMSQFFGRGISEAMRKSMGGVPLLRDTMAYGAISQAPRTMQPRLPAPAGAAFGYSTQDR